MLLSGEKSKRAEPLGLWMGILWESRTISVAKLDVTLATLALATGCHGGDEGDQGGWMVRHGHLKGFDMDLL